MADDRVSREEAGPILGLKAAGVRKLEMTGKLTPKATGEATGRRVTYAREQVETLAAKRAARQVAKQSGDAPPTLRERRELAAKNRAHAEWWAGEQARHEAERKAHEAQGLTDVEAKRKDGEVTAAFLESHFDERTTRAALGGIELWTLRDLVRRGELVEVQPPMAAPKSVDAWTGGPYRLVLQGGPFFLRTQVLELRDVMAKLVTHETGVTEAHANATGQAPDYGAALRACIGWALKNAPELVTEEMRREFTH